jgi:hypothetical protein
MDRFEHDDVQTEEQYLPQHRSQAVGDEAVVDVVSIEDEDDFNADVSKTDAVASVTDMETDAGALDGEVPSSSSNIEVMEVIETGKGDTEQTRLASMSEDKEQVAAPEALEPVKVEMERGEVEGDNEIDGDGDGDGTH